jgi:hypothetical protein
MGPSPGTSGESGGFLSTIANSSVGQGVLGVGYGLQKSFTPGGFLAPSPTDRPAFQVGMGVGEIVGGATQMGRGSAITGAGVGIAGLGVATEGPSLGTSTIAVVGGAAVATAGVAIVANGVGSVAAGGNTILNAARGSGSDSASGGPTAAPGGDGAQGGEGKGLRRPYIRKGTRSEVEEAAPRDAEGRPIDPNTGKPIEGKADLGHKPGNEFRREKAAAEKEGLTQKKFNDRMNDPDKYQLEDPASNRSHKYEQKP